MSTSLSAPHYVIFPIHPLLVPLRPKYSSQHPVLKHPQPALFYLHKMCKENSTSMLLDLIQCFIWAQAISLGLRCNCGEKVQGPDGMCSECYQYWGSFYFGIFKLSSLYSYCQKKKKFMHSSSEIEYSRSNSIMSHSVATTAALLSSAFLSLNSCPTFWQWNQCQGWSQSCEPIIVDN